MCATENYEQKWNTQLHRYYIYTYIHIQSQWRIWSASTRHKFFPLHTGWRQPCFDGKSSLVSKPVKCQLQAKTVADPYSIRQLLRLLNCMTQEDVKIKSWMMNRQTFWRGGCGLFQGTKSPWETEKEPWKPVGRSLDGPRFESDSSRIQT
jgi:hypothetical protein